MDRKTRPTQPGRATIVRRPMFQPLVIALVCIMLTIFLGVMATINLTSLEATLRRFTENRGVIIIRNLEQDAQGLFAQLSQPAQAVLESETGGDLGEQTSTLQELRQRPF